MSKVIPFRKKVTIMHPCSSCDEEISLDEMDSWGRCERCAEENPLDGDDEEDEDE